MTSGTEPAPTPLNCAVNTPGAPIRLLSAVKAMSPTCSITPPTAGGDTTQVYPPSGLPGSSTVNISPVAICRGFATFCSAAVTVSGSLPAPTTAENA